MSKRKLLIEVDCGKRRCKRCELVDHDHYTGAGCALFDAELGADERGRLLRRDSCLKAEDEAEREASPAAATQSAGASG